MFDQSSTTTTTPPRIWIMYWVSFIRLKHHYHHHPLPPLNIGIIYGFRSVPHCSTSQAPPPPHLNPPYPTLVPFLWRYYVLQPNIIPIHDHGEIFWGERCTKLTSYPMQLIFSRINQPYLQQNSWSLCRSWYFAHRSQILCQYSKHLEEKQKYSGFKADTAASYYLLALPTMLTKSSVCVNPILYFGFNPQVFSISFSIFPSCSGQLKNLTQIYMASSTFCAGIFLLITFPGVGLSALLAFQNSLAQMSRDEQMRCQDFLQISILLQKVQVCVERTFSAGYFSSTPMHRCVAKLNLISFEFNFFSFSVDI